jgi:hypothetical protein
MATYYLRVDGNDSNAGTADTSGGAWRTLGKAGSSVAAGDTVYIRASAGNASTYPTSSLDYTISAYFTPTNGTAASPVSWVALGGVPTIGSPGLGIYNAKYQNITGLYFVATSADNGSFGIINGETIAISSCILNANTNAVNGISVKHSTVVGVEVYGGSTSPSSTTNGNGIYCDFSIIIGSTIRYCRNNGIYMNTDSSAIHNCTIYKCVGNGIRAIPSTAFYLSCVTGNTVHDCDGHGIEVNGTNGVSGLAICNNNVTSNGSYGLSISDGSSATNDARKIFCDYNNFYGNTSGSYQNVSAGTNDLNVDPEYTSEPSDLTPENAALQAGFP